MSKRYHLDWICKTNRGLGRGQLSKKTLTTLSYTSLFWRVFPNNVLSGRSSSWIGNILRNAAMKRLLVVTMKYHSSNGSSLSRHLFWKCKWGERIINLAYVWIFFFIFDSISCIGSQTLVDQRCFVMKNYLLWIIFEKRCAVEKVKAKVWDYKSCLLCECPFWNLCFPLKAGCRATINTMFRKVRHFKGREIKLVKDLKTNLAWRSCSKSYLPQSNRWIFMKENHFLLPYLRTCCWEPFFPPKDSYFDLLCPSTPLPKAVREEVKKW